MFTEVLERKVIERLQINQIFDHVLIVIGTFKLRTFANNVVKLLFII